MSLFDDPVCRAAVLLYANTPWGRRQLCIDQDIPPGRSLIDIGPNRVTWLARQERPGLRQALRQARRDGPTETTSDFRCRPKIANRLFSLADHGALVPSLLWAAHRGRKHGFRVPGLSPRLAFADEDLSFPDPHTETATWDGYVGRQADGTWSEVRDGAGTTVYDSGGPLGVRIRADSVPDQWDIIRRNFLLFDTSGIGPDQEVSATTLRVVLRYVSDSPGWDMALNFYSSNPASNTGGASGDFQLVGDTAFSDTDKEPSDYIASPGYTIWTFNQAGRDAIAMENISKFSQRDAKYDVADSPPTWTSNGSANYQFESAEYTGTSRDPRLTVTYSAASSYDPSANMMLLGVG